MLLSSGHFVNDIGQNILPTLTPILIIMFSMNNATIGFLIGIQHIAGSILQPLFGYIDDKYSFRLTAPIGMLITTSSISLIGIITNYNILLVIALSTGIGTALFHPAATAHVSHIAKARRNTVISIFIQIGSIGFALGPLFTLILIFYNALENTTLLAIPSVILFILMYKYLKPVKKTKSTSFKSVITNLQKKTKEISVLISIVGLRSITYYSLLAFLPSYGMYLGMGEIFSGSLTLIFGIAGVFGGLIGGYLADIKGTRAIVTSTLILSTPCIYLITIFNNEILWIFVILAGMLLLTSNPIIVVMLHKTLPDNRGLASSFGQGFGWIWGALTVPVIGIAIDLFGFNIIFQIISIIPILSGLLIFLKLKKN